MSYGLMQSGRSPSHTITMARRSLRADGMAVLLQEISASV